MGLISNAKLGSCLLMLSPLVAQGQLTVPLLHVSAVALPQGGYSIVVRNDYSAPAEDYVIADRYFNPEVTRCPSDSQDARGRCVSLMSMRVQIPHSIAPGGPDPLEIAPGESRTLGGYGKVVDGVLSNTNVAVIYADGAMAGAPSVLDQLVFERKRTLVDLVQDAQILSRASQVATTDWGALAQRFRRRAQVHDRMLNPVGTGGASGSQVYGFGSDRICPWIAQLLQPSTAGGASGAGVPDMVLLLHSAISKLEQSKPLLDSSGAMR
ncbi:MAG: hypothetical protein ACRD1L_02725 [Terriglobales bacterium]